MTRLNEEEVQREGRDRKVGYLKAASISQAVKVTLCLMPWLYPKMMDIIADIIPNKDEAAIIILFSLWGRFL